MGRGAVASHCAANAVMFHVKHCRPGIHTASSLRHPQEVEPRLSSSFVGETTSTVLLSLWRVSVSATCC